MADTLTLFVDGKRIGTENYKSRIISFKFDSNSADDIWIKCEIKKSRPASTIFDSLPAILVYAASAIVDMDNRKYLKNRFGNVDVASPAIEYLDSLPISDLLDPEHGKKSRTVRQFQSRMNRFIQQTRP